jgi:hypothetical protein
MNNKYNIIIIKYDPIYIYIYILFLLNIYMQFFLVRYIIIYKNIKYNYKNIKYYLKIIA